MAYVSEFSWALFLTQLDCSKSIRRRINHSFSLVHVNIGSNLSTRRLERVVLWSLSRCVIDWIKIWNLYFCLLSWFCTNTFQYLGIHRYLKYFALQKIFLLFFFISRQIPAIDVEKKIDPFNIFLDLGLYMNQGNSRRNLKVVSDRFYIWLIIIGPNYPLNLADFTFSIWL